MLPSSAACKLMTFLVLNGSTSKYHNVLTTTTLENYYNVCHTLTQQMRLTWFKQEKLFNSRNNKATML